MDIRSFLLNFPFDLGFSIFRFVFSALFLPSLSSSLPFWPRATRFLSAGVSIHFPDGNKNSELHKSNQVSINSRGEDLAGLEEARRSIRDLMPLIYTFSLPAGAQFVSAMSNTSLVIANVQNLYNVQVRKVSSNSVERRIFGTETKAIKPVECFFLFKG